MKKLYIKFFFRPKIKKERKKKKRKEENKVKRQPRLKEFSHAKITVGLKNMKGMDTAFNMGRLSNITNLFVCIAYKYKYIYIIDCIGT